MTANELSLVIPTIEHKIDAMEYRQEWIDKEPGHSIHGSGGFHHYENYEEWRDKIETNRTNPPPEFVPGTVYFAVYNNKIVGTIAIRYRLNADLLKHGGHIGYGVRPSERRKGCATKMLALALEECKKLNIGRVLITCDKSNIGSARTIQKNGGVLENEITDDSDGEILQRYWIDIT